MVTDWNEFLQPISSEEIDRFVMGGNLIPLGAIHGTNTKAPGSSGFATKG
jgi:hypothetical protein